MTVRLPDDLASFVMEQAEALHTTRTDVVVRALQAERRRLGIEHERTVYASAGGEPYPDLPPATTEDAARVWKDVGW